MKKKPSSTVTRVNKMRAKYEDAGLVRFRFDVWAHPSEVPQLEKLKKQINTIATKSREKHL